MSAKAQKPTKPANPENEIDVQKLWEKYEDIAMHSTICWLNLDLKV